MSINFISILLFYSFILLLVIKFRKKFDIQAKIIALYRTQIGLKLMDKIAKKIPSLLKILSIFGIAIGYIGMITIVYLLIDNLFDLLFIPTTQSAIALVIPGIKIPGSPVFVPFWYGILSIFIVATVHEFAHGVIARLHNLKVKSSGIVFFGPIIGAFVEPDEKQLKKASPLKQLSVFAAGPFSNILTAFLVVLVSWFILTPIALTVIDFDGVHVQQVQEGFPAYQANMQAGEMITSIDGVSIHTLTNFTSYLDNTPVNTHLTITTQNNTYTLNTVPSPDDGNKSYIGVYVSQRVKIKDNVENIFGDKLPWVIFYIMEFFKWLFVLNIGIGVANLLPLGPVDGGRILQVTLRKFIKNKDKADYIWKQVSILCLLILALNLFFPLIRWFITGLINIII